MTRRLLRVIALELTGALLVAGGAATAQEPAAEHHAHAATAQEAAAGPHAHAAGAGETAGEHHAHAAAMQPSSFKRSLHEYSLPEVTLRDQAGRPVPVKELEGASGPLAVNFIFTTCTTICPVMTATFAQMRRELGPEADRIRLVSITIDPEHDTPAALAEYAARFGAPAAWSFLTGSPEDVRRVLLAFDAWSGSKANHRPITLLRRSGETAWVRLEGLGSGAELAEQARNVLD